MLNECRVGLVNYLLAKAKQGKKKKNGGIADCKIQDVK